MESPRNGTGDQMKGHRVFIVSFLVLTGLIIAPLASAETPSPPASSGVTANFRTDTCSQYGVTAAPDADKDTKGQPIVSKPVDGKRPVPVILVHGWNGSTGTFTQPIDLFADGGNGGDGVKVPFSLTGQLENIPGLAVYNFDYSQYSNRWVTDSNVGPRLASAIECLTDFYGTKAEIIAHSMGGLAARFALDQKASKGPAIKDRVSQVVTFGTPNTGSAVAALAAKAIANGAASNLTRPNVASGVALAAWIITYICGRQMTHSTTDLTFPCDNLPSFVTGFDSDAGQALRSGSPQLQALADWPSTVHVTAVEGSTMFRGISLFGAASDEFGINGGDIIVDNNSASAGSGTVKDESCGFALAALTHRGDTVLQAFGPTSGAVNDGFILHIIDKTNPCFHQNLLRTINGTNAAVGAVKPEAANPVLITGVAGSYTDRLPSDGPAPSGSALLPVTGTLAPGFEPRPPGIKWFHDVPRAFGEARDALTLRLNTSDGVPHYFDHSVAVEAACTGDQAIAFDEFSTDKGAYSKAVFTLYFHNTRNPDQPVTPGRRVRVRVLAGPGGSIWLGSTAKEIMNSVYTTGDPLPSFSVNVSGYGVIAILPTFDTCQMTAGIGTELVDSGFIK